MACIRPVDAISGGPEVIGCRSALESFVSSQLAHESFAGGSDSGGTPASPFNKDAAWITCDAVTRACSKKPPWRTALQTAYLWVGTTESFIMPGLNRQMYCQSSIPDAALFGSKVDSATETRLSSFL